MSLYTEATRACLQLSYEEGETATEGARRWQKGLWSQSPRGVGWSLDKTINNLPKTQER